MGQSPCFGGPEAGATVGAIPLTISLRALRRATNRFSQDLRVGEGGSAHVYRGTLRSGQVVAVKRLKPALDRNATYDREVNMVAHLSHPNIITLIGCCAHEDTERIIVYEFMPMRTLYHQLHARIPGEMVLNWITRMRIAAGVAKGLSYLHNEAEPRVIYRDLKPTKVLLGVGYEPKITDFRIALTAPSHGQPSTVRTTDNAGIHPYRAPEAAIVNRVSPKSDVYSFGVLFLEIITGKLQLDIDYPQYVSYWIQQRENFANMVNGEMNEQIPRLQIVKAMTLAMHCIKLIPAFRPDMSDVVIGLRNLAGEPNVEWPEQFSVTQEQPESSNRNRSRSRSFNDYRSKLMNPNMLPRF